MVHYGRPMATIEFTLAAFRAPVLAAFPGPLAGIVNGYVYPAGYEFALGSDTTSQLRHIYVNAGQPTGNVKRSVYRSEHTITICTDPATNSAYRRDMPPDELWDFMCGEPSPALTELFSAIMHEQDVPRAIDSARSYLVTHLLVMIGKRPDLAISIMRK
jgi:hypothetical protein